jgi:hypothetical protein
MPNTMHSRPGRLNHVRHSLLHPANVGFGDHPSAEHVAQIMEAQAPESRTSQSLLVAPAERRTVEV